MARSWHVIRTEPRSDSLAAAELERGGWQVFAPRLKTMRLRPEPVDSPLFPGYLFVNCDLDQEGVSSFGEAPHVLGWLQFSGLVPSVSDEVINALVQRVEMVNREGSLWTRFRPGQKVRVASRFMNGLGEVVEGTRSPQTKVRVLIEFMGRLVTATVARHDLQPIDGNPYLNKRVPRRTRGRGRWVRDFKSPAVAAA